MKFIFGNRFRFWLLLVLTAFSAAMVLLTKFKAGPESSLAVSLNIAFLSLFIVFVCLAAIKLFKINNFSEAAFFAVLTALAFWLRYRFFLFGSGDFFGFLDPWLDLIRQNGGLAALKDGFSDYNPPYLYLLAVFSYFPISNLFIVKIISAFFDLFAAFFVGLLVGRKYKTGPAASFAFFAVLFAPTVLLNGSFWGQCDVIFTSFLVASVYFLARKKNYLAVVFYALAFLFKLQAIFLAPLFVILLLKKNLKFRQILLFPVVYLLGLLPNFLLGRPLKDLLLIYLDQTQTYKMLTLNAPTVYQWLPLDRVDLFYQPGLILAAAAALLLIFAVWWSKKTLNADRIVKIALVSVVLLPFLLPRMHERYFFAADIFAIIFAFYFPRYFYLPILMQLVSFFSYQPFLFEKPVNFSLLAFGVLAVITAASYSLIKDLYFTESPPQKLSS